MLRPGLLKGETLGRSKKVRGWRYEIRFSVAAGVGFDQDGGTDSRDSCLPGLMGEAVKDSGDGAVGGQDAGSYDQNHRRTENERHPKATQVRPAFP